MTLIILTESMPKVYPQTPSTSETLLIIQPWLGFESVLASINSYFLGLFSIGNFLFPVAISENQHHKLREN